MTHVNIKRFTFFGFVALGLFLLLYINIWFDTIPDFLYGIISKTSNTFSSSPKTFSSVLIPLILITLYSTSYFIFDIVNRKKFADSIYYMGFIFTLLALLFSLISYGSRRGGETPPEPESRMPPDPSQDSSMVSNASSTNEQTRDSQSFVSSDNEAGAENTQGNGSKEDTTGEDSTIKSDDIIPEIIAQNGYALSSTVWGLCLRILIVQFERREEESSEGEWREEESREGEWREEEWREEEWREEEWREEEEGDGPEKGGSDTQTDRERRPSDPQRNSGSLSLKHPESLEKWMDYLF